MKLFKKLFHPLQGELLAKDAMCAQIQHNNYANQAHIKDLVAKNREYPLGVLLNENHDVSLLIADYPGVRTITNFLIERIFCLHPWV